MARGLAEFGIPSDLKRTNYADKTGGQWGLGDNSGIIYGPMGVCHQMCNVITISTVDKGIANAPVNYPDSLVSSWWEYGFRGTVLIGDPLGSIKFLLIVSHLLSRLKHLSTLSELPTVHSVPGYLNDLYEAYNKCLKEGLEKKPTPEVRALYLETLVSELLDDPTINIQNFMPAIVETDTQFQITKHDLDNLLIKRQ